MNYKIELQTLPSQPVMSVKTRSAVGNLPHVIGQAYGTILTYLQQLGEQPVGAPFVAYYNMDMEDLELEIGFPVAKPLPGTKDVLASEIPAGRQVSCVHTGPYDKVGPVYDALMNWVKENGYTATGVAYEFYYNSPMDTPEEELQTKIMFPLE